MMDKNAIIKQLQDAIDRFKRENELLKGRIRELEAKLAMYDNAYTPPSLRLFNFFWVDSGYGEGMCLAEVKNHEITRDYTRLHEITRD